MNDKFIEYFCDCKNHQMNNSKNIQSRKNTGISLCLFLLMLCFLSIPNYLLSQIAWEQIPLPDSVEILSFEVGDNGDLYIGTEQPIETGVYQSDNNGATWEYIGLSGKFAYDLEFTNDNQLFATTSSKIYKYMIEDIWELKSHNPSWNIRKLKYLNSTFFGGGYSGIIRSVDEGDNWELVLDAEGGAELYSEISSITEDSICAVCTNWVGDGGGVYLSGDNGDNWTNIGLKDFYLRSVAVDCTGNILAGSMGHFYTGQGGLYRYNKSIGEWDTLLYYPEIHSIEINENNDIYLGYKFSGASDGGGVMHSEDNGETWILDTVGIDNSAVDEIIIAGNNYLYAMGGYPDFRLYKSSIPVSVNKHLITRKNNVLNCFPNPATTNLTITYKNTKLSNPTVSIINSEGKVVYKQGFKPDNQREICIDISSFNNGVYIVVLSDRSRIISSNKIQISN